MCKLSANEWYQDRAQLQNHTERCVSPELAYSCTYRASHLNIGVQNEAGPDAEVTSLLKRFASKHLLAWLEALSIIRSVDTAYGSLDITRKIMQLGYSATTDMIVVQSHGELPVSGYTSRSSINTGQEIFSDACRLIERNPETLLSSPMHICHSALPLLPPGTALYRAHRETHRNMGGCSRSGGGMWSCNNDPETRSWWILS